MGDGSQGSDSGGAGTNGNKALNDVNGGPRRQVSGAAAAPSATTTHTDPVERGPHSHTFLPSLEDSGPASSDRSEEDPAIRRKPVDGFSVDRDPLDLSKNAGRQGDSTDDLTNAGDEIRNLVGRGTVQLSEWVNSNLIVARYAAYAGIGLLAAYGITHSPLFFRFRTVADIPSHYFFRRRKIRCRLVAAANETSGRRTSTSSASSWESSTASMARDDDGPIRFRVR
jgi:hypothetical protein